MQKITVIGSGYVGLVAGTCLADFGNEVICVDNDENKIIQLNQGHIPIYEPGLDSLIERNVYYKRLSFTTDIKTAVENSEVIFIAVGTPPAEDGSADLKYVLQVAHDIAVFLNGYKVIVNKSTVPVGTGQKVKQMIKDTLAKEGKEFEFDVVSNPEFLREGTAIYDFMHPDRVVIGVETKKAQKKMEEVYRVLNINSVPFVFTNLETAEMVKYASNAFLAMKITFINEVANICEVVGADVHKVAIAMGKDGRISPKFLHPGPGYGGSCFPKDTKALASMGRQYDIPLTLVEQTIEANEHQKIRMIQKIRKAMEDVKGKTIAVLGITFKPNTDDMREAPSLVIIEGLVGDGARVKIYDPEGEKEGRWRLKHLTESITFCHDEYEATKETDAIVILTEWNQFRNLDLVKIKNDMKGNFLFDFRNIYEREIAEEIGFRYYCVGR